MDYQIDYKAPARNLNSRTNGQHWNLNIPDDEMQRRSEYLLCMDPMLDYDTIASMIMEKYGNFSCRFCYSPLVMDGKNGSGTKEFLCMKCRRKMSLYNTFELVTFRYRKELTAFLSYVHSTSSEGTASLYGLGSDLFNEMRMSLPEIHYSRNGEPDNIAPDTMALQYYYCLFIPLFKYLVGNAQLHVHEEDDPVGVDLCLQCIEEFIQTIARILVSKVSEFQVTGNAKHQSLVPFVHHVYGYYAIPGTIIFDGIRFAIPGIMYVGK